MTRKLCKICAAPLDNPRDISHYRTCVRKREWPEWVTQKRGTVTAVVEATLMPDGSEPVPFPPVEPLPEEDAEPAAFVVPEGALLAVSVHGSIACNDCDWIGQTPQGFKIHRGIRHKEPAIVSE